MPGGLLAQGHAHLEEGLPFPRPHKGAIWASDLEAENLMTSLGAAPEPSRI